MGCGLMETKETAEYCGGNEGMDCYADDRDALNDFAKYYNNEHLSDVSLQVDDQRFAAHKIVLCRSSEVFDRMLSKRWSTKHTQDLTLTEDSACSNVFDKFLRFLYCNHVLLNESNVLALLILADKYSVHGLRKVCVDYAIQKVLPFINLKSLIHVWFKYSTTAYHRDLTRECVQRISKHFWLIITDDDWNEDWLSLDRDQLVELLKSNDLVLPNEYTLWEAVQKWFNARGSTTGLIAEVMPLIRFPYMTADELSEVETSGLAQQNPSVFSPLTHLAFKFISMTLSSRASSSEFNGLQFLVRDYTDIRWDKRIKIAITDLQNKHQDHRIITRASTFPLTQWEWELIFARNLNLATPYSSPNTRELSIELKAVDLDQSRSVEYLFMCTNDKEVKRKFAGKKTFTKSRTTTSLELENRLTLNELLGVEDSDLILNGELNLQLVLRPIV
ncbi:BTB domain-containing protein [Aphelenchoides besseyi]|nr:BTB domain-containing protein [Aphelenchoides besseyi]KAI6211640.1 BTB domain-containing protein [Aphelenchoides besseyi]